MTEGTREKNLLQTLIQKTRLSWKWATISLTAVLLLLLIVAALLDRSPGILLEWEFWHFNLNGIFTTVYLVAIYPFVVSLREKAVQAFKPLLPLEKNDFDKIAADIPKPNRWEWASILPGIIIPIILGEPWKLGWDTFLWLKIHLVTINIIMWCLLCWLIFDLFVSIARITRLSRQDLKLDILDTETLAPIARWSLGISLVIAGGICLNLLFETMESLLVWNTITAYAIVIFALILIFFLSMWGTHRAMSTVKKQKLSLARKNLVVISRELENRSGQYQPGELGTISSELTSWANYQRLIKEAPTWPFNAGILRQLLASIVVPAAVYLVKILAGLGIRF